MKQSERIVILVLGWVFALLLTVVMTSIGLQMCASETFDLSQDLIVALQASGYEYWLDFGTLLGAEREQTMILHDYDADIGMRESEFQRLKSQWQREPLLKGMRLKAYSDGLYRVHRGLAAVDIFRYSDLDPNNLVMLSQGGMNHHCGCGARGHSVNRSTLFPLRPVQFGRTLAPAPQQTHDYLTHLYGSTWRVPRITGKSSLMTLVPLLWRKR